MMENEHRFSFPIIENGQASGDHRSCQQSEFGLAVGSGYDALTMNEDEFRKCFLQDSATLEDILEDIDSTLKSRHEDRRRSSTMMSLSQQSIDTPPDEADNHGVHKSSCNSFTDPSFHCPDYFQGSPAEIVMYNRQVPMSYADLLPKKDLKHFSEDMDTQDTSGAYRRCEARIKRLEKLNIALEEFSADKWSFSDNRHLLERRLYNNRYWPAIQSRLLTLRLRALQTCPALLHTQEEPQPDLGLSARARNCGADVASELTSLRMVQKQSLAAVGAMLRSISADVPICGEEARAALARARQAYDPAKRALRSAVDMLERQQPPPASSQQRKGQMSEEARGVLEDWTMKHFDNPYPSQEEKQALVKMTGLPLRFINNWLSNYRVRIWRPAVSSLHND